MGFSETTSFHEVKKAMVQPCLQKPGKAQIKSEAKKQGDITGKNKTQSCSCEGAAAQCFRSPETRRDQGMAVS